MGAAPLPAARLHSGWRWHALAGVSICQRLPTLARVGNASGGCRLLRPAHAGSNWQRRSQSLRMPVPARYCSSRQRRRLCLRIPALRPHPAELATPRAVAPHTAAPPTLPELATPQAVSPHDAGSPTPARVGNASGGFRLPLVAAVQPAPPTAPPATAPAAEQPVQDAPNWQRLGQRLRNPPPPRSRQRELATPPTAPPHAGALSPRRLELATPWASPFYRRARAPAGGRRFGLGSCPAALAPVGGGGVRAGSAGVWSVGVLAGGIGRARSRHVGAAMVRPLRLGASG
ncbi:hypothetical protein SAMN05421684_4082 [Asanoa ishikariensis]|uniref:Uncharacterized protein n=1 Tax=Asanoa ishikariensis TaxID=137265 RepID=A0A1H3RS76_9ACTN|nr:hypothetical protein SAMN05421684_4082 [Asanoa ishikariensis]